MGQKQNKDEIEYGVNCLTCFDSGETPKYVYARFSNISKKPGFECSLKPQPPNDHAFTLTQRDGHPCQWRFEDDNWQVTWYAVSEPAFGTRLVVNQKPDWLEYFYSDTPSGVNCETFFLNEAEDAEGTCGLGGWGMITWRLESLELMELLNIITQEDLFMEMFPLENGKKVYKYCKVQDATNVKILYDPT